MSHGIHLNDPHPHAFLSNHENVVLAVLHKDFDAGAVRMDIFNKYRKRLLRVFHGPIAIPPHVVVCGKHFPNELLEALRTALLTLRDQAVFKAVNPLMTGFAPVEDKEFDEARIIVEAFTP